MSDQSPSRGRDSRLAISGWPLRSKVALALAIPLLLAATFGGLRVTNDLRESNNASASSQQVSVIEPAIAYLTAAETGMVAAQSSTGTSQVQLDDAVVDIRAAADALTKARESADLTAEQGRQVDTILDLSRALRDDDDTGPLSPGTWVAEVRQMQSGVTKLITTIINEQITPEPRLELLSQTLSGRFSLAQQQAIAASERTGRNVEVALFAEYGAESVALDRLAGQRGVSDSSIQTLRINNLQRANDSGDGSSSLGGADAYGEYDNIQASLIAAVDKELSDTASAAQSSALLNALLTAIALAAAIALAFLISRTLVNPIRRVREGALQVANVDLPAAVDRIRAGAEPGPIKRIDVTTHEEVGQLARAVDDLHQQAVNLAAGEAKVREQVGEMFVTLSRRNTTLINQQLNLIEKLESDEEDPKRLESLFRLDHLAARMRRTADSLLILADAPTRSAGWESVSIGETLQAATAGVNDYQRVRIESDLPLLVNEAAAGDLVHMITELVDNSLSYSSPHTNVVLDAQEVPNGVSITVVDAGLGVPVEELKQINENLSQGVEVTPDTARRMGLFVVSRLAQRHGVSVRLKANDGDGTTAFVMVPNAILPERAHLEPVPVEEEPEPIVEDVVEAAEVHDDSETLDAAEVEADGADESSDADALRAPTPLPTRGAAEPTPAAVDENDPLGIGDSHLRPVPGGLPTRERGATLPTLSAAGLQVPSVDGEEAKPEEPREMKRATGAMPLLSKRDLAAGPAVSAVPDLPKETDEVEEADDSADVAEVEETYDTASALDEPAVLVDEETTQDEPAEVESVEVESVEDESAEVESVEPAVEVRTGASGANPEAHIAALMAKIRPQRGRLPIPEYEEVDHAAILQMPTRDRSTLGDPLNDPFPAEEDDVASDVLTEVEALETVPQPTYTEPAYTEAPSAQEVDEPIGEVVSEASAETDVNGATKSSWLSTDEQDRTWASAEVEAGWQRADVVAETHDEATSSVGLPVRTPGARLVPGSVTKPTGRAGRDPEAIRARLSAHKAGVRRGRSSSVPADDQ